MRFAHISDLHLSQRPESNPVLRHDVAEVARAIVADIDAISDILDFVVLSGDLTDDADPASFAQVERILSRLGLPVFTVPGNHDGPAAYAASVAQSAFLAQCDLTGRCVDLGAIRLLGIDTCIENSVGGAVREATLDLLAQELAAPSPSQLVIVMHHPPFLPGLAEYDGFAALENRDAMARLVAGAARPPIVLSGHIHRPYAARWQGASCFVAGSPAGQFGAEKPFGNAPLYRTDEEYAYFVHEFRSGGDHVVTTRKPGGGRQ